MFVVNNTLEVVSVLKNGRGVFEEEVDVHFDMDKYGMKETEATRKMIEEIWREKTKKNSRLFNQSKYRLDSYKVDPISGKVDLFVGLTCYKDHVGTNLSETVDKLVGEGEHRFDMLSQCVGVGGWVITQDKKVIFVESAAWKGEQACKIDRPGGHAEPDESIKSLPKTQKDYKNITGIMARKELFECIQKEVRDEINIPLELQEAPELVGIVYNLKTGGRLGLEYFINVKCDSVKVKELYSEGGPEADESTDIFFIDIDDVKDDKIDKHFLDRLTPHATGSLELLKKRLKKEL